ncbi:cytochrome P450 monooxygenase like protein [Zymoseptoria brevis]|uniref:Cytochrome P450 monooxygenase like protein n=1 Tax=Zymoseptoria brevis TaxID=1047168 RepID=A0A0F4GKC6_9PEZI|nr:cytochrome P450 monooxygenase like protein [Zymoseptoria brevis]
MSLQYLASNLSLNLLALLPFGLAIYAFGIAVYRIWFHPLAKYPGPLLAKITDLHSTYHALKGNRHLEFWRNHEKYGPVYRFGPNSVSFNSNTALKDIYGFKSNVQKAEFYQAFWASKDAFSTHSSIDKAVHARKRRVLSQAFSDGAIKSMENHILAHIRQFCANLAGNAGTPTHPQYSDSVASTRAFGPTIDITDQSNYLAFDIMGDLCFGKSFNMLTHPDNRFPIDLIASASHRHLICGTYLPIHTYHLDKLLFRKIAAGRARYMQYSKAQAGERMKMGMDVDRKDFFYHLLSAKDPETGRGFAPAELWGESNLLIIAGSDTTSTAIAATIFYLVHNAEKLEKLTQEVRGAFDDVEEIRFGQKLSSLPYVRACIDEAMRLSPSVGGLLPREVLSGGIQIDGALIPAGTVVGVPSYTVQHNEAYFPRPWEFRPERWIAGSEKGVTTESVARAQSAFIPFSVGPRGCIGKGMAYAEMTTTIARMVWLYDLRLTPGSTLGKGDPKFAYGRQRAAEFQLKDSFTSIKEGPEVQFRARS